MQGLHQMRRKGDKYDREPLYQSHPGVPVASITNRMSAPAVGLLFPIPFYKPISAVYADPVELFQKPSDLYSDLSDAQTSYVRLVGSSDPCSTCSSC